jgi:hypothetical protein
VVEVRVHVLQTGSEAHLASYAIGTGDSFTGNKAVSV